MQTELQTALTTESTTESTTELQTESTTEVPAEWQSMVQPASAWVGSFGATHFGAAKLGDKRLTDRLVKVADAIMRHPGGSLSEKCVRQKSRQRFTTEARRHGAEPLSDDWHHFAKGRGRFDRIHRINRMPTCCISGENHPVDPVDPVDPVQSSDQHGSRAFSHMWSSP